MRNSLEHSRLLGILTASFMSMPVAAQFLDLDPVPEEPQLESSTLIERNVNVLRSEIDSLRQHESSDDVVSSIAAALRTHRRVAFELLAHARMHPEAHHAALAGILLAEERDEIDLTLVLLGEETPITTGGRELEPVEVARLLALLDRFVAQAPNLVKSIDASRTAEIDAALLLALDPLLEVLAVLEEVRSPDPWIAREMNAAPPLQRLHAAIDNLEDPGLRTRSEELLQKINPLLSFVDLRHQAESDGAVIANALRLEKALEKARWLAKARRIEILQRLDRTLQEWMTPATRDHARAGLQHLAALTELIEAANGLDKVDPSGRSMRRSIDEIVCEDVEADRSERLQARSRRLTRATAAVDAATTVREMERQPTERHLRTARRALDVDYKRAEREVFNRLTDLVGTADALVDPDLAGLVARQHDLAENLQLLRESQAWSELAREVAPDSSDRFNATTQKLAQQLSQTTRRPDASGALDSMAIHFRSALQQPFLDRLRETDEETIRMVGGRDRELLAVFDDSCKGLVEDWSQGPDGAGIRKFELLVRLLAQFEMLSELLEAGGTEFLPRWGGWMLHPSAGQIDSMLIASRLKIAIESLLRDDIQELENQLDQIAIEAPLALLAARLGANLGPGLLEVPEGTGARIARLARTPGSDAALLAYREDLLTLARFTWELNEARRDRRHEDEQAIREYCAALAAQLAGDLERN